MLTTLVIRWCDRMASRYGPTVRTKEGGVFDWGQALARECYGIKWTAVVPDAPTHADYVRAVRWEEGDWPDWAEKPFAD